MHLLIVLLLAPPSGDWFAQRPVQGQARHIDWAWPKPAEFHAKVHTPLRPLHLGWNTRGIQLPGARTIRQAEGRKAGLRLARRLKKAKDPLKLLARYGLSKHPSVGRWSKSRYVYRTTNMPPPIEVLTYGDRTVLIHGDWASVTTKAPDVAGPIPWGARRDWAYARTLIDTKRPPVPRPFPPAGAEVCGNDTRFASQYRERDDLCFDTGNLRCFARGQYSVMTGVEEYMGIRSNAGQSAGSEAKALIAAGVDIRSFLRGWVLDYDTDQPALKRGIKLKTVARYMHESGVDFSGELTRMAADPQLDFANRARAAKTLWFLWRQIQRRPHAAVEAAFEKAGVGFMRAWTRRAEGSLRRRGW
jgi:hypothetical protein